MEGALLPSDLGEKLSPIISFISDFGLEDTWVGVCHAVIKTRCPAATVVDLGHQIPPFDLRKAASMAAAAAYQLPDAIHLVVVDPGVGGGRKDVCLTTPTGTMLVGPDNGILIPAARRCGGVVKAYQIIPGRLRSGEVQATFHARDILAPAAAELACSTSPSEFGEEIHPSTLADAPFGPCTREDPYVVGEVLEADRFGSLRFNIPSEQLSELGLRSDRLEVSLGHNALTVPMARTFSDVEEGEPVVLVDSSGWLTLALNRGDAADRYGVVPGTKVRVRPAG